jgi:hypothetical protein
MAERDRVELRGRASASERDQAGDRRRASAPHVKTA